MCGRFGFTSTKKIKSHYGISTSIPDLKPRYNIAPSQKHPVLGNNGNLEEMLWGLIPFWTKDLKEAHIQINARDDSVSEKPMFKKSFTLRRCLIPADFFFEWKRTDGAKIPYVFKLKNDDMFSFAGLFDAWTSKNNEEIKSFAIITTSPNSLIEEVHNRMPVILHKNDYNSWLNPDETNAEKLISFLKPFPSAEMISYRISTLVNKPINDNSSILEKI
jgi:putative SOS response-associated peptidase YedK